VIAATLPRRGFPATIDSEHVERVSRAEPTEEPRADKSLAACLLVKHASRARTAVTIAYGPEALELTIVDLGPGPAPQRVNRAVWEHAHSFGPAAVCGCPLSPLIGRTSGRGQLPKVTPRSPAST
jgi:hypothetical protein